MGTRTSRRDQRYRFLLLVAAVFTAVAFLPGVAATGVELGPDESLGDMIAADRVRVTTGWSTVEFPEPFAEPPIVVAGPASWVGRDPATVRVRNVTASSFQVRLTEWPYLDGNHTWETVSYLAVPAGIHELPSGGTLEAGSTWVPVGGTTGSFAASFTGPPALAATLVSYRAGPALAVRPAVTASGFSIRLRPQEADSSSYSGRVNWIAWSDGSATAMEDGVAWETHKRMIDNSFERIRFDRAYSKPCVLAAMNTRNGGDTANLRYRRLAVRSIEIRVDEERSANPEVAHTNERIGVIAVECAKNPPTIRTLFEFGATLVGSPTLLRGYVLDEAGVDRVSVAVRRRADGTWLQADGSFGYKVQRFDADFAPAGHAIWSWSHAADLPEGDYSLSVRAWDSDDNHAFLVPWHHFSVVEPAAGAVILAPGSGFTSIELDRAGNPIIAYAGSGDLNVIHCDDAACLTFAGPKTVATGLPDPTDDPWFTGDLEIDPNGWPVIAIGGGLIYCDDPDCDLPPAFAVLPPDEGVSLELDVMSHPVVSGGYGLSVTRCTDAYCFDSPVTATDFGHNEVRWTSLELDAAGFPVVATWDWFGDGNAALELLHCADPYCLDPASQEVIEMGFWEVMKAVSLELDTAGNPVIAVNQEHPEPGLADPLRVITCGDVNCAGPTTTATIDARGGLSLSLRLAPGDLPVVAYNSQRSLPDTGTLALARCGDRACVGPVNEVVVDNDNVFPEGVSLVVDGSDTAFVSYTDGTGNLRFARVPAP